MHSRIFEISSQPIEADDRLTEYAVPEWFCNTVADYVDTIPDTGRNDELDWLVGRFAGNCKREGDKLIFLETTQEEYFRKDYGEFREALAILMNCNLETFCGKRYDASFHGAIYRAKSSYEDQFGFYVYDRDAEELMTLDSWVRDMDVNAPCYAGGIVDYHF